MEGAAGGGEAADGKSQWLINLQKKITQFSEIMPNDLPDLKRNSNSLKNPLFRFLDRENTVLSKLLKTVKKDFQLCYEVCIAERKSTNYIRQLMENLHADVVPTHWKKYIVPPSTTASNWLYDFKSRVEQLQNLHESSDYGRSGIKFGCLLAPEAFLIAT